MGYQTWLEFSAHFWDLQQITAYCFQVCAPSLLGQNCFPEDLTCVHTYTHVVFEEPVIKHLPTHWQPNFKFSFRDSGEMGLQRQASYKGMGLFHERAAQESGGWGGKWPGKWPGRWSCLPPYMITFSIPSSHGLSSDLHECIYAMALTRPHTYA